MPAPDFPQVDDLLPREHRTKQALEPTENGLSIESAMLIEVRERQLRLCEVNVDFDYDVEGSNVSPGRHTTSVIPTRRIVL